MNKDVVYHGSSKSGLTKLTPFECKHGKPYVYATRDYQAVLHFSAKGQGMFDGWVEDENGIPTYYEARYNSFYERYWSKKSYCYTLPADTFKSDVGDDYEVVSEVEVEVIDVKEIENVGAEFQKLMDEGKFKLVKYDTSEKNTKEKCEERALQLLIDRGYFVGREFRQREWASEHYKDVIKKYKEELLKLTPGELTDLGICPTCFNRENNGALYGDDTYTLIYKDKDIECFFVGNPRSDGHMAISTINHYHDMSEAPDLINEKIVRFSKQFMIIIKEVYKCERVYFCTMCDGLNNHYHIQLIPRYSYEKRGSINFVKERKQYVYDEAKFNLVKEKINKYVKSLI